MKLLRTRLAARHIYTLFLLSLPGLSQAQSVPAHNIPRISSAPVIDGQIDPEEWQSATRIQINIETNPGNNIEADVSAEAFLMEDGEVLYVAFIAHDPEPDKIRAYYRDRDNSWGDDLVGVVLDTFNDERRAYEFYSNPFGVQTDTVFDAVNGRGDSSWNAIWDSAGQLTDSGYVVEMGIPFKQLRFSGSQELQTWGIDLLRFYPRDRSNRISNTPQDRDISCYLCQLQKFDGFANLQPSTNLEIIPTLTSIAVESRDPAVGDWEDDGVDTEGSLDVRWGITQDIYLNATINPDFSQVETDRPQLDVNNTFSLYFPERRTFFLDGADYFNTTQNLIHTRNIADPEYGAKITGKSGNHTYAFLNANDELTSFLIPGSQGSTLATLDDFSSDVNIGRYRYDIFGNSTIGVAFTDRQGDSGDIGNYANSVASIDAVLRPTDQDTVSIQTMYSESDYPEEIQDRYMQEASTDGSHHSVTYRHYDSRWDWQLNYRDVSEDFRADVGFISRVDYKYFRSELGHSWRWDGDSFFDRIRVAMTFDRTDDQSGLELEDETQLRINMNGPFQSYLSAGHGFGTSYWNGQYFEEQSNQLSIGFTPVAALDINVRIRIEDEVDFANTRLGRSKEFGPSISYLFGRHLEVNFNHTLQQFDVDGGRLFTANLTDLRTTYQFNARSFLRLTVQYRDTERDQDLYSNPVNEQRKQLTTQLLYSYKLNPATRFFIGYSDDGFQDDNYSSIEPTKRTLFAKFSYAWQPF